MLLANRINSVLNQKQMSVKEVLERFASEGDITHVDFNYPEHFCGVEIEEMKKTLTKTGLQVNGLAVRFRDPYINGELGNADELISRKAIELSKEAADVCESIGGKVLTIWLGYDGFDYAFQVDYAKIWKRTVAAFQEIADHNPRIKISIEYKPFQPRAYAMIDGIGTTMMMIQDIDRSNVGITLDYCHMLMKRESPAYGLSLAAERGKLFGVHLNDGYRSNDDGMMIGSASLVQTFEFIYYLRKYKYDGVVYFDTFPVRENAFEECRTNVKFMKKLFELIDMIGEQEIERVISSNDAVASQNLMLSLLK